MKKIYYLVVFGLMVVTLYVSLNDSYLVTNSDEYGCVISAGYSYNSSVGACVREFDLNDSQRKAAMELVHSMGFMNSTIVSVVPDEVVDTVYEIVVQYNNDVKVFYVDKDPLRHVRNKTMFGCDVGFGFCPDTGECINKSLIICGGGSNITSSTCETIFGIVRDNCLSSQTAIANVGDGFCCGNKEDIIIMPSNEVCNTACEVMGFVNGTCSGGCINCVMLGTCSGSGVCACSY